MCRRRPENLHRGKGPRFLPRYRLPLYQRGDQCDRKHSVSFACLPICKAAKVDMASPPTGVIAMISILATDTHKALHCAQTDETMVIPFGGLVFLGHTELKYAHRYRSFRMNQTEPRAGRTSTLWADGIDVRCSGTAIQVRWSSIWAWRSRYECWVSGAGAGP